jgi:hypothetical protein
MPANSFSGVRAVVVSVVAEALYKLARIDAYANLLEVPSSGTSLQLPDQPGPGDWYAWSNPDLSCQAGKPIVLTLSAAAIADGITIQGATSASFTTAGTSGVAVYMDHSDTWALFVAGPGGSGSVGVYNFVIKPGVPAVGNVFPTFAALYAYVTSAAVALQGQILVTCDDSVVSPIPFAAASYPLTPDLTWTFVGTANYDTTTGYAAITLDDGFHFVPALPGVSLNFDSLQIASAAAADIITVPAGCELNLDLSQVLIEMMGAGAFVNSTNAGGFANVFARARTQFGDGTHAVFNGDIVSTELYLFDGGIVAANSLAGTGTLVPDATAFINAGAVGGWTESLIARAVNVTFVTAQSSYWDGAPPTIVSLALDILAQGLGTVGGKGRYLGTTLLTAAAGNFTTQAATTKIHLRGVGAGGGGGAAAAGAGTSSAAGGGGAGSYLEVSDVPVAGSTAYAYTTGPATVGGGVSSTFTVGATTYTAPGGGLGSADNVGTATVAVTSGGTSAEPTGGDINAPGGKGGPGLVLNGATGVCVGGLGGASAYSGGALTVPGAGFGTAALGFGGGGSGAAQVNSNGPLSGGQSSQGCWYVDEFT